MNAAQPAAVVEIRVVTHDGALPEVADYARDRIGALVRSARRPVPSVRVRLSRHGKPEVPWAVVAQANLFVDGVPMRAQAEGGNSWEAVDRLEERLRCQLCARRGSRPEGAPPRSHRWYHRPETERRVVRRKSCALRRCTVEEAAREMGLLDYDFHLFVEATTGQDAVLVLADTTGYRLTLVAPPGPGEFGATRLPLTVGTEPAPRLTVEEAVVRSNEADVPFLFFVDTGRDRGAVLYRRYDGHYGLITPPAEKIP
ncbi:sigma 54 modulation/S30EA ribosomal C-terminal domain-containing protein [Amycolatopsis pigmentata]|uniref:Sigma 54 modulation/S30EA ribosomal C-terminal domain-containing protein n=1 Tax=Amycolatopsis pigmentata TaxID=450801 RepID=A0ABW5FLM1_9PSEU